MASSTRGRSAPWAKVLGVLFVILIVIPCIALITLYISQLSVESSREDAAFQETKKHAERHAAAMTALPEALLAGKNAVKARLDSEERNGRGISSLYEFTKKGAKATEVVMYTEAYEKANLPLSFGMGAATRCFTITYTDVGTSATKSTVFAHDRETSCAQIAEDISGTG